MSIAKLLDILRGLGSEPSAKEVAEALWWMLRTASTEHVAFEHTPAPIPLQDGGDEAQATKRSFGSSRQEPGQRTQTVVQSARNYNAEPTQEQHTPRDALMSVPGYRRQQEEASHQGRLLMTPAVTPLPDAIHISRALRPFRRHISLSNMFALDEHATAHRSAEEHMLVPVMRRLPTPWLAVDVIVDESKSMVIWQSTVVEFVRLLARQGAFRDVRVWGFDPSSPDPTQPPSLHTGLRRSGTASNIHSPTELVDVGGRRLVLIVSDCIAPGWHTGAVAQMMNLWAPTNPMAIVQMLPRWLWERTSLGREIGIEMRSPYPGAPNAQALLRAADERLDDDEDVPFGVSTPVLSLNPAEVASWANYSVSAPRAWTRGVQLSTTLRALPTRAHQDGVVLLKHFYANASPQAQALAEHLSAAPLTLPVINLVQEVIAPLIKDPSQIYTAEVLLGGIAYRVTPSDQLVSSDEILYDFLPGVRERLQARLDRKQLIAVIDLVSKYIEHVSRVRQMESGLIGVPRAGQRSVIESLPFAKIRTQLLRAWGYTQLADWLENTTDPERQFVKACQTAREYHRLIQPQLEEEKRQRERDYDLIESDRHKLREGGASPFDGSLLEHDRQLITLGEQIGFLNQALTTLRQIHGLLERDEGYEQIEQQCTQLSAMLQAPLNELVEKISSVLRKALDDAITDASVLVDIEWVEADNRILTFVLKRYPGYHPAEVQRREWAGRAFKQAIAQDDQYDDFAQKISEIQQNYWANQEVKAQVAALDMRDVRDMSGVKQALQILERLGGLQNLSGLQEQISFDPELRLQRRHVLVLKLLIYQQKHQEFRSLSEEVSLPSTIFEKLELEQKAVEAVEVAETLYRNQEWQIAALTLQTVPELYAREERAMALQRRVGKGQQDELNIKAISKHIESQLTHDETVSGDRIPFNEILLRLESIQVQLEKNGIKGYRATYEDLNRLYAQRWQEHAESLLRSWGGSKLPSVRPWLVETLNVHARAVPRPASDLQTRLAIMLQGWANIAEALVGIDAGGDIQRASELLQSGVALLSQTVDTVEQMLAHPLVQAVQAIIDKQRSYVSHLKQDAKKARDEKRLDRARDIWDRVITLDPTDEEARNERLTLLTEIKQRLQEARTAHEFEEHNLREAVRLWAEVETMYSDGQYPVPAVRPMPLKRWLQQAEHMLNEAEQQIANLCPEAQQLCVLIRQVEGSPSEQYARWSDVMTQVQIIERTIAAMHSGMQSEIPSVYQDLIVQIKEYSSAHRELLLYLSAPSNRKDVYTLIADLEERHIAIQLFDRHYQDNKHACALDPIDEVIGSSWKQVVDIASFLGIKLNKP